jgi:hypothetical protein
MRGTAIRRQATLAITVDGESIENKHLLDACSVLVQRVSSPPADTLGKVWKFGPHVLGQRRSSEDTSSRDSAPT